MQTDVAPSMDVMMIAVIAACLLLLVFLLWAILLLRARRGDAARLDATLREELRLAREEAANQARHLREEVAQAQRSSNETLVSTVNSLGSNQKTLLDGLTEATRLAGETQRAELGSQRAELQASLQTM
jgi:signal transduction histidine kinase